MLHDGAMATHGAALHHTVAGPVRTRVVQIPRSMTPIRRGSYRSTVAARLAGSRHRCANPAAREGTPRCVCRASALRLWVPCSSRASASPRTRNACSLGSFLLDGQEYTVSSSTMPPMRTLATRCAPRPPASARCAPPSSKPTPNRGRAINVPAGTFTLSLAGATENLSATGDIDIVGDLDLVGAGSSSTTISAAGLGRSRPGRRLVA